MGLQILIVDDSAAMRSILKKVVSLAGYEVDHCLEAQNGQEALDVLSQNWVDVILLDVHMPVMDGITMLEKVKENDLFSKIPIVLVTTEARKETLDRALSLGAKAHVKKPFRPETIRDIFQNILGDEYARRDEVDTDECDF